MAKEKDLEEITTIYIMKARTQSCIEFVTVLFEYLCNFHKKYKSTLCVIDSIAPYTGK
jgi:hypothetical protein